MGRSLAFNLKTQPGRGPQCSTRRVVKYAPALRRRQQLFGPEFGAVASVQDERNCWREINARIGVPPRCEKAGIELLSLDHGCHQYVALRNHDTVRMEKSPPRIFHN